MEGVPVENPVDYPSGLRESASGTGPSLARGTPRDHAQGHLGRQPGRSQRECRLSVQQEAPAGDRPEGALPAQVSGIPKVVDYRPEQEGRVFFGAWVEIENEEGRKLRFRIVGYDEIFDRKDYISIDSPMARALLKKEVDDEAQVTTEAGTTVWYINSIEYEKS